MGVVLEGMVSPFLYRKTGNRKCDFLNLWSNQIWVSIFTHMTHPTQFLRLWVAADADLRALWMGVVLERMVSPFLMELFPCFTILRRIEIWGKLSNNANSLSSFYEKNSISIWKDPDLFLATNSKARVIDIYLHHQFLTAKYEEESKGLPENKIGIARLGF